MTRPVDGTYVVHLAPLCNWRPGRTCNGLVRTAGTIGHSLRVYRKDQDHKSGESQLPNGQPAPMPWSVFYDHGGIAFPAGDPDRSSAGRIRMEDRDARASFNYPRIGDQVQVVNASEERAVRGEPVQQADDGNSEG